MRETLVGFQGPVLHQLGAQRLIDSTLVWIVKKFPNATQQRLVGTVIGSASGCGSIENREAAARSPIKFGIQVGICREQGLYDFAVESIDLAMGASGGRGSISRASE